MRTPTFKAGQRTFGDFEKFFQVLKPAKHPKPKQPEPKPKPGLQGLRKILQNPHRCTSAQHYSSRRAAKLAVELRGLLFQLLDPQLVVLSAGALESSLAEWRWWRACWRLGVLGRLLLFLAWEESAIYAYVDCRE